MRHWLNPPERTDLLARCLRLEEENALLREQMSAGAASRLITRAVVELRDSKHLSFRTIGERLGMTEGAAYKRYAAAQRRAGNEERG
jgi:hypothetical protein